MKLRQILRGGNLHVEHDASNPKEAFRLLAQTEEVFGQRACGACKSVDIKFIARKSGKFEFFELGCTKCGSRLSFGQHNDGDGTLFPRRKDDNGNYLDNNGWVKWEGKKETSDEPKSAASGKKTSTKK